MDINQLTTIFCQIDDFCKDFDNYVEGKLLPAPYPGSRGPQCSLSDSEIMTILVAFQNSGYRNFKTFYLGFLATYLKGAFPKLPSYHRFLELIRRVIFPLILLAQCYSGKRTGIYYVDSTCLPVSHLKRSSRHQTFKNIANYGKTSMGWFFGFKLHLVINHQGELMAFKITRAHQHDSKACESLLKTLKGLAFGDKGYIGKKLAETLLDRGLKLITRTRKNMKAVKRSIQEQQLLNQRGIIETVINHLKHHYQVWHTRHRSVINAMTHLIAAIAAYAIQPMQISAIKMINHDQIAS